MKYFAAVFLCLNLTASAGFINDQGFRSVPREPAADREPVPASPAETRRVICGCDGNDRSKCCLCAKEIAAGIRSKKCGCSPVKSSEHRVAGSKPVGGTGVYFEKLDELNFRPIEQADLSAEAKPTTKRGDSYFWNRPPATPVVRANVRARPGCNCAMCRSLRKYGGYYATQCRNGVCSRVWISAK